MAQSRLQQVNISFTLRRATKKGPTSSYGWNDMYDEISNDLTDISYEWNSFLYPLLLTVPDGTDDEDVDAFSNGLDGANLYTNADATSTSNSTYYDTTNSRPYSIFEQFVEVYSYIDGINSTLSGNIDNFSVSATNTSVSDTGGYFTSDNVEGALAELGADVADFLTGTSYLALSGGILTGQLSHSIPTTMIPTGTAQTVDWNNGNIQVIDLASATGTVVLSFTNADAGARLLLKVIQGGTARDITWPAGTIWPGGSTPTISTSNDDIDRFDILYDGTNYIAIVDQAFA